MRELTENRPGTHSFSVPQLTRRVAAAALALLTAGCMTIAEYNHAPLDPAASNGRMEAMHDIREGRLILRSFALSPFGVISPWQRVQVERLGVEVQIVAVFVVAGPIVTETAAYNRVMRNEIRRRFGADALRRIEQPVSASGPVPVTPHLLTHQ